MGVSFDVGDAWSRSVCRSGSGSGSGSGCADSATLVWPLRLAWPMAAFDLLSGTMASVGSAREQCVSFVRARGACVEGNLGVSSIRTDAWYARCFARSDGIWYRQMIPCPRCEMGVDSFADCRALHVRHVLVHNPCAAL